MATNAGYADGAYIVSNDPWLSPIWSGVAIVQFLAGEATTSTSIDISLPLDAVVDAAVFELTADAAGPTVLSSIGQVRAGETSNQVVIDFGRMVTLQQVSATGLSAIKRWNGVEYVTATGGELQTERLLVQFSGPVDLADVADQISATLPTVPTGLELVIDGRVVWSEQQGNSAGRTTPAGVTGGIGFTVDRTAEVASAIAASGGTVRVELRSQTPGDLTLTTVSTSTSGGPEIEFHRVHRVAFPDGPARTIELAEEGLFAVTLPLPSGSEGWDVSDVTMTVSAQIDDSRRLPAVGPTPSTDGRLRLRPDRMLLGHLPPSLRDRALLLDGVRVAVRGGEGGDLAGRVLADAAGMPGDPLPGAEFTPVEIEPGDELRWVTLQLTDPVGSAGAWIEIGPSVGTVDWVLTTDDAATETPGTDIYFRTPGGAIRSLPVLDTVGQLLGGVRLIVRPDPDRPLGALSLELVGNSAGPVEMTPDSSGTACRIVTAGDLHPAAGGLVLAGVAATPGTFTFSDIVVSYREASS